MSDVPQTLALIIAAQEYRGDILSQVNRRVMALKTLPIKVGGGKNWAWAPKGDGHIFENYTDGQDASNFGSDEQQSAILTWSLYRTNFHVTDFAMDTSGSASTPVGNQDLWLNNMIDSSAKLAKGLEGKIFTGAGTGTEMAGLDVAIGDDTNTYAGLLRSTYTWWKPTVVDPGVSTGATFNLIRSDLAAIAKACGEKPDVAYVGLSTYNAIAGLFDTNLRYTKVTTARGVVILENGMDAVIIDGCQFLPCYDAPEGKIYYINSNYVEIRLLPNKRFMFAMGSQDIMGNDGFGIVPLLMHFDMLAKNGPSERAEITLQSQLIVRRPNSCGIRKNVAYT